MGANSIDTNINKYTFLAGNLGILIKVFQLHLSLKQKLYV